MCERKQYSPMAAVQNPKPAVEMLASCVAATQHLEGFNYVTLGTVDESNRPHTRTVICLGLITHSKGTGYTFLTDSRTAKVAQLRHQPYCEVNWWFPTTQEQYRIAGVMAQIGADHPDPELSSLRATHWKNYAFKELLLGPTPGDPVNPQSPEKSGTSDPASVDSAPPNFLLLVLWAERLDYLNATTSHRQIDVREGDHWVSTLVNR